MADLAQSHITAGHGGDTRRDFLILSAGALDAIGPATAIWPFIDSLNPARIRQGPAPLNLFVPPYEFTAETAIKIG